MNIIINLSLLYLSFTVLSTNVNARIFGEYITDIHSVDDVQGIQRKYGTWLIQLRKVGRYEKQMQGYIHIFEQAGPLSGELIFEEGSVSGWKKSTFGDNVKIDNICQNSIILEFLRHMNITSMLDSKTCMVYPGKAYLQKFDLDKAVRDKIGERLLYGTYRATVVIRTTDKPIIGIIVVFEFKDASLYSKNQGPPPKGRKG